MPKDKLKCFICARDFSVRETAKVTGPHGEIDVCLNCYEKNKSKLGDIK